MRMLNIKRLLVLLLLSVGFSTTFAQTTLKVGTKSGSVENMKIMKGFFSTQLEKQGITEDIKDFTIVKKENDKGDTYFLFQGATASKNHKIAIVVFPTDNNLYLTAESMAAGTVTCSGCAVGCDPERLSNGKYMCSLGCSVCSKSVTITTKAFDIDPIQVLIATYQ